MGTRIHVRYMRSSLAGVFFVKSERKRSPGTAFAAEDIRAIFVYNFIAANF